MPAATRLSPRRKVAAALGSGFFFHKGRFLSFRFFLPTPAVGDSFRKSNPNGTAGRPNATRRENTPTQGPRLPKMEKNNGKLPKKSPRGFPKKLVRIFTENWHPAGQHQGNTHPQGTRRPNAPRNQPNSEDISHKNPKNWSEFYRK